MSITADWSIDWRLNESADFRQATDAILTKAWDLAPKLRERARETELLRRMPEQTMADAKDLWNMLVPKRWGGLGLGSRAICETARILAHGDASSAWALSFLIEHSHMACHLPWEAQEELFADRSFILASAPLSPGGNALKVDGGYQLSGTFRYASGIGNSDWTFATAFVDENGVDVPYTFLVPLNNASVTVNDDWHMSGMAATSSASVTVDHLFIPKQYAINTEIFDSADLHPGARHEEAFLRYPPLGSIRIMVAAVSLGSAEACIDLARERMAQSKMFNIRRLDLPLVRVRWATAFQKVRAARLIYRDLVERMIKQCEAVETWTEEFTGQAELDLVTIVQLSKEAVFMGTEGLGSSVFKLDDPVQRYRRDVDVMSSHLFQEYDFVAERASRVLLGLGYLPTDPYPTRPPKVSHHNELERFASIKKTRSSG
ncbi:hypothetical protein GOZ80_18175 [Agrobacterium vitis]|uniref:Acyl-CoA dehydrogenase C-terminal domain-containing protein n=1 Tax=Agrobacterium vitis TaxID=373 RepID=A0AAE4X0T7_AGRVI|nr:acyl-CoA dehydrogenase family protein [Agrobacterium vitis]MBF2714134.1 hypothetical protein [Agrobacterium vitis]MUO81513.1 hypothetical protein [Agrobacterium vitis]MUO95840.1 hypothetical protein [Agrobacterium vitis]MVA93919.1 hypothetical protein [Agrobacterium vitis]MVB03574.1 hypothetical protein [Agrobacterium vitis]